MDDEWNESEGPGDEVFPPPARGWRLAGVPILAIVLMVVLSFGTEDLAHRWAVAHGEIARYRQIMIALGNLPQREILEGALIYIVTLLALVLLIPRRGPARLGVYLRRVRGALPAVGFVAGIVAAAAVIFAQILLEQNGIVHFHESAGERAFSAHTLGELPLALALVSLLAPLVEELYFRGLLLGWLRRRLHAVYSIAISAVLFALAHGYYVVHGGIEGWIITGFIALLGVMLGTLAISTRSLWPSIAAHCGYNASLTVLPFFAAIFAS